MICPSILIERRICSSIFSSCNLILSPRLPCDPRYSHPKFFENDATPTIYTISSKGPFKTSLIKFLNVADAFMRPKDIILNLNSFICQVKVVLSCTSYSKWIFQKPLYRSTDVKYILHPKYSSFSSVLGVENQYSIILCYECR